MAEGDRAADRVELRGIDVDLASHASGTDANASLTSKAPMSPSEMPLRSSARWVAGIGAVSIVIGSAPTTTHVCTRASGVQPYRPVSSLVVSSRAAAPSVICEELPAVMTPSGLNAAFQLGDRRKGAAAADALVGEHSPRAGGHRNDLALERPWSWASAARPCDCRA